VPEHQIVGQKAIIGVGGGESKRNLILGQNSTLGGRSDQRLLGFGAGKDPGGG